MLQSVADLLSRCLRINAILILTLFVVAYVVVMDVFEFGARRIVKGHDPNLPWLDTPPSRTVDVDLDPTVIHCTDPKYLSFSIDSAAIQAKLRKPSLTNQKLRNTVRHLSGGYLRVGGTAADLLVFSPGFRTWTDQRAPIDGGSCSFQGLNCPDEPEKHHKKFSMSADMWNEINSFANATGLKLLFDLNVLLRSANSWNHSNAELLLDFSFAYQYKIDWQLGNEPDSFRHQFGVEVLAKDLAADFNALRHLLNRYGIYNTSRLVGPDVTNGRHSAKYLSQFLDERPNVDAVTWHHYYSGRNATLDDYLSVDTYKGFVENCRKILKVVKKRTPGKPLWLGETGSSYGGGIWNLSNRFVASLLWADKLGAAATEGISLVVRQSLYRGHYSLLDEVSLVPNPDYWVSILFRKLVGTKVFKVNCPDCSSTLRLYGICSKMNKPIAFGVNIGNVSHGLQFNVSTAAFAYFLTAPTLGSQTIELNGKTLSLTYYDELPDLEPVLLDSSLPITIPQYSIFFIQFNLIFDTCLEKVC